MISAIISAIVVGAIVGALGRLVVRGNQNISMVATILIGIVAALLGTFIARALGVGDTNGIVRRHQNQDRRPRLTIPRLRPRRIPAFMELGGGEPASSTNRPDGPDPVSWTPSCGAASLRSVNVADWSTKHKTQRERSSTR